MPHWAAPRYPLQHKHCKSTMAAAVLIHPLFNDLLAAGASAAIPAPCTCFLACSTAAHVPHKAGEHAAHGANTAGMRTLHARYICCVSIAVRMSAYAAPEGCMPMKHGTLVPWCMPSQRTHTLHARERPLSAAPQRLITRCSLEQASGFRVGAEACPCKKAPSMRCCTTARHWLVCRGAGRAPACRGAGRVAACATRPAVSQPSQLACTQLPLPIAAWFSTPRLQAACHCSTGAQGRASSRAVDSCAYQPTTWGMAIPGGALQRMQLECE